MHEEGGVKLWSFFPLAVGLEKGDLAVISVALCYTS